MAELSLHASSPLAGLHPPAAVDAGAGVVVREHPPAPTVALLARRNAAAGLAERCGALGLPLPTTPRRVSARGITMTWVAPGQWWLRAETAADADRLRRTLAPMAPLGTLVEFDDSRISLDVSGPQARATLAKVLAVDLHPRAFRPGDVAVTVAGGVSVVAALSDDGAVFDCAVPRSYAEGFTTWLLDSAAEYGVRFEPATEARPA